MNIIEPRLFRGHNGLGVLRRPVTVFVPLYAALGVIAIRRNLHAGPRAVFTMPVDQPDKLFMLTVAPQANLALLGRVDTVL